MDGLDANWRIVLITKAAHTRPSMCGALPLFFFFPSVPSLSSSSSSFVAVVYNSIIEETWQKVPPPVAAVRLRTAAWVRNDHRSTPASLPWRPFHLQWRTSGVHLPIYVRPLYILKADSLSLSCPALALETIKCGILGNSVRKEEPILLQVLFEHSGDCFTR